MHVLVVTHHKSKEGIVALYDFLRIGSDAIFSNQNGSDGYYELGLRGHMVKVYCHSDVGVAKNRNHLLDHAPDGLCLCVDDDCVLQDGYTQVVERFFEEHRCDVALFNGHVPYEGNRLVHDKKTARVRRFKDVSYAGGPGLAFIGGKMKELGLRYDERLGYPNDLYAGEDSLFLRDLSKSDLVFYRASDVVFTVAIDKEDNSSYFKGFDDQFFYVKGAVGKLLYPHSPLLYPLRQALVLSRRCKVPFVKVRKLIWRGRKAVKDWND